jgi:hypothetical protein
VPAGHDLPAEWKWAEIRAEVNPKERYFEPPAESPGAADGPGGGRKRLAEQAASRWERIRQLCPEDIGRAEGRIRERLDAGR